MYAQCPDCLTVFSMDAETIAQARGLATCGHCGIEFDALTTLSSHLPPEPFQELPVRALSGGIPQLESAVYRPRPEPPAIAESTSTHEPETGEDFTQLVFAPKFVQRTRRDRRWPWVLACLVLLILLGIQLAWAKREALVADATTGPWLKQACSSLGCQLPLVRDTEKLRLLARDVQAHPSVPGALLITATVSNDADFDQPWPVVAVTLSDVNGKRLAMRRLRPLEYLGDGASVQHGLAAGSTAALVLEVDDPGNKAVAFEFSFE
ncbi:MULTISPECIES: zinc-ribbon and DUF3426 domain-containing protein [Dyella]|uniref:DUF3426 domain-containing protein n=2 Tax=Dyella TaxID=231454 RepID=A0A4R0YID4_9GAMM|nr:MULTISPECIES: zinc-ribbon and DUF3426 domain-containing protein [Dyella]TBR36760.1 DUF3426 domain-containing protein [Dyella terrae]TCI08149.1 DUF3426 domain-containing protein [Dyella soli]